MKKMIKNKIITPGKGEYKTLFGKIAEIIVGARSKIVRDIDTTQVYAYWFIGKVIIEHEQDGRSRAEYGQQTLINLSRDLTQRFGKGFSVDNLQNMRRLFVEFKHISEIYGTASRKSEMKEIIKKYETGELTHADAGQMNFYLNYFRENETTEGETPPIGIILCSKKNAVYSKYVLGNLNNKIFASKYRLTLPTEKELNRRLSKE